MHCLRPDEAIFATTAGGTPPERTLQGFDDTTGKTNITRGFSRNPGKKMHETRLLGLDGASFTGSCKKAGNKYTKSATRTSIWIRVMRTAKASDGGDPPTRLAEAYERETPRLMARLRAAGRSLEDAEDFAHDIYAELMEHLPLLAGIRNLPAWINSMVSRRIIDAWRHDKVRAASGETDIAEDTFREILSGTGLDPQDSFVEESLVDALNDALRTLPEAQRRIVEAQVFGGLTFREIAEATGDSIDTLTARKRYAIRTLSRALKHWIED